MVRCGNTAPVSTSGWQLLHELRDGGGRLVERRALVGGERDLDDPLQPAGAEDDRDADEQAVDAVLAL